VAGVEEHLNEWFIAKVLVHERALMRFLARAWPDHFEIDDLRHEIYIRIYEAAAKSLPTSPRGLLFSTARHLMVDRVRRGRVVSIEFQEDLDALNVLIDDRSPDRVLSARQDLWHLGRAFETLPASCRDIMWMVKIEELTQKEIAERLNLTVRAVEKRIAMGLRFLQDGYLRQARSKEVPMAGVNAKGEPEHG
jgi:RNA polymerase sigma-70 factor (ECF subfamily)